MNEYLFQLINKAKYPFAMSKNIVKRRAEQSKDNIPRNERLAEIKMLFVLAAIVLATVVAIVFIYLIVLS